MSATFSDIVQRAFYFLEEAGFRCIQIAPSQLRYENEKVFVTISWDSRSGEIEEFIGLKTRKGEQEDGFSLSDLLAMEDADVPERRMPFQVADANRLNSFLEKLAKDTSTYARAALTGNHVYFRRLRNFRNEAAQMHMEGLKLRAIRTQAEKAWQRQQFGRVVDLYTSMESSLSKVERGRLEYAKKHTAR